MTQEYNFKFFSYLFMKELVDEVADRLLTMIDYSKDMTVGKYVHRHSESETSRPILWPSEELSAITVRTSQGTLTLSSTTRAW